MLKILIADDESLEREQLTEILSQRLTREAEVRTAENGRRAVELAELWKADLLLLDIEMPGISGIEAARRILERCPQVKIIFVTAYSLFQYALEAVRLGACDYILKPVNADDVENAVRRAAAQIKTERQLSELAQTKEARSAQGENSDKVSLMMSRVREYLRHNYMYDISLDSVSGILHISPSHLSAEFKRSFGVNFVDYLTEVRVNAAKELLADPLRSSAEVANLVGYETASYFIRVFKKKTGQTPTEYRRGLARQKGGPL